ATADDFVFFVLAAQNPLLLLPRLIGRFGPGAFGLVKRLASGLNLPITSLATTAYYSALPIRYGAYAARLAIEPHARPGDGAAARKSPDYLGEELSARLAAGAVGWDFRVQLYSDDQRTPIEDGSRDWDAPY